MEKKRIKELLTLMLNKLMDDNREHHLGICHLMAELKDEKLLDDEKYESFYLKQYLKENMPTPDNKYKEFLDNKHWIGTVYWWTKMQYAPETRYQRIKYLSMLISDMDI